MKTFICFLCVTVLNAHAYAAAIQGAESKAAPSQSKELESLIDKPLSAAQSELIAKGWLPWVLRTPPSNTDGENARLFSLKASNVFAEVDHCAPTGWAPCNAYYIKNTPKGPSDRACLKVSTVGEGHDPVVSDIRSKDCFEITKMIPYNKNIYCQTSDFYGASIDLRIDIKTNTLTLVKTSNVVEELEEKFNVTLDQATMVDFITKRTLFEKTLKKAGSENRDAKVLLSARRGFFTIKFSDETLLKNLVCAPDFYETSEAP